MFLDTKKQRFYMRGHDANERVLRFVLHRSDRNMVALLETLEQLDCRALAEQRTLTIPFVKCVMGW